MRWSKRILHERSGAHTHRLSCFPRRSSRSLTYLVCCYCSAGDRQRFSAECSRDATPTLGIHAERGGLVQQFVACDNMEARTATDSVAATRPC